jgi:hypothetical protein
MSPSRAPISDKQFDLDDRQMRALGSINHAALRNLTVGVVGAGGTGSYVIEMLGRLGVAGITVIDPDIVDTPSNLRRLVGSRPTDEQSRATKVGIAARNLAEMGYLGDVRALNADVRTEGAARALLSCDLVIASTDTMSSRALINQLAVQYWIPTIDVGVRIGTSLSGEITGMPAECRVLLPDAGCLWCRGVLDSNLIHAENLPTNERQGLAAEGYVQGVAVEASVGPLNVLAAAQSVLVAMRLCTPARLLDASFIVDGWQQYFHPLKTDIDEGCICHRWRGRADDVSISYLPEAFSRA